MLENPSPLILQWKCRRGCKSAQRTHCCSIHLFPGISMLRVYTCQQCRSASPLHCSNQHLKWRVFNILLKFNKNSFVKKTPRHISASPVLKAMRKRPSKSARTGAVSCRAASEGPIGVSPGNHQRIHGKKGPHNEKTNWNWFGLKRNIMTWVIFFEFSHSPFLRPPVLDLSISFSLLLLLFAGLRFYPIWIKFWHFQILETTGMWFQQSSTAIYKFQNTGMVLVCFFHHFLQDSAKKIMPWHKLLVAFLATRLHLVLKVPHVHQPVGIQRLWTSQHPNTLLKKWPTLYKMTKRLETRDAGIRCEAFQTYLRHPNKTL